MPEGDALSLGDIQRKFADSLKVIDELKGKLEALVRTELTSGKAGEQLQTATKAVDEASAQLKSFAASAKSVIEEFGLAMKEAGKTIQQTTLADLESAVASIQTYLESTVAAAQARAEAAEIALAKIPEKYRIKFTK